MLELPDGQLANAEAFQDLIAGISQKLAPGELLSHEASQNIQMLFELLLHGYRQERSGTEIVNKLQSWY